MTAFISLFLIALALILGGASICTATKAGEKDGICKYGKLGEEDETKTTFRAF